MPGVKGAVHATPEDKRKFHELVDAGWAVSRAAEKLGFSDKWGYEERKKLKKVRGFANEPPEPKSYADLDGGVKDTLKDFNLFREVFLCRRKVPWAKDAAMRTADWLLDKTDDTFTVANCPPGSGKTTLFTKDLVAWLICGGGAEDPAYGRALRIMLGSNVNKVAIHYVTSIKLLLESPRPFYDKEQKLKAELSLVEAFGRFKPKATLGEYALWQQSQFIVAQIGDLDVYEKEPTVQAASKESGFLGERVNLAIWDDLVTDQNSRSIENSESLATWWESEAETRIEPGGLMLLVGQRLSSIDLYRNRLEQTYENDLGEQVPIYNQIIYPAHLDALCDNNHRQWDGAHDGCLLDEVRLKWDKLLKAKSRGRFNTVYQQEDSNPEDVLVHKIWLEGGTDAQGDEHPGCYDRERGFLEWPDRFTYDYVCVDPSVTGWWVAEWWAMDTSGYNHLIYGVRRRMTAGGSEGFLDWDDLKRQHVGLMPELQEKSKEMRHPINLWIVEQNAAHKYLFQTNAFKTWKQRNPAVEVTSHQTQKVKNDHTFGVFATLPMVYKTGMKRLPRRTARDETDSNALLAFNYLRSKEHELTHYPQAATDDTIMADWFGEMRRDQILKKAQSFTEDPDTQSPFLPAYLQRRNAAPSMMPRYLQRT